VNWTFDLNDRDLCRIRPKSDRAEIYRKVDGA
jgi:hypothetical protein